MARNQDYKVLLLTSVPDIIEAITAITREHLPSVESIYWEMGNLETKPAAIKQIEARDYTLITSHINSIILKPNHLAQASLGAVNIHRALSLVPEEVKGFFDLDTAQYLPDAALRDFATEYRDLTHAQIELLAARVSAINRCHY